MQASSAAGRVAASPNVTPMIDVMLVLLIIFMVVAPALMSGVVAEPPLAANFKPRPEKDTDHTLAIDASGVYYLDRRRIGDDALGAELATMYPPGTLDRVLFVRAHRDLEYRVLDAMETARTNGVVMLGLISERKPTR